MTDQIFISYSKKDSDFAHQLADDLEAAGFKIWIDKSIGGGDLWRETIEKNLKAAGEVIIVVSPNSMASEWVKHEGSLAYGWGKQLFPILIEPVESLPPWLEEYQWIDFVNLAREIAFDALVAALTPPNPIQDLLDQQVQAYQQTGELIGEAILRVVDENRVTLTISAEAQKIVEQSQKTIEEREQTELEKAQQLARTQRQRAIVLAVGLLVAVVLSIVSFSLFQQSNRNLSDARLANTQSAQNAATADAARATAEYNGQIALSRELAANSISSISELPDLAILLAVESYKKSPTRESTKALASILNAVRNIENIYHNIPITKVIFSPDGNFACVAVNKRVVAIIALNSDSLEVSNIVELRVTYEDFLFNNDSNQIIFGLSSGEIFVFDPINQDSSYYLKNHQASIANLRLVPEGFLASNDESGLVTIWNLVEQSIVAQHAFDIGAINSIDFSVDDGLLAISSISGDVVIWDFLTDNIISTFHTENPSKILFDGNKNLIISGNEISSWSIDGNLIDIIQDQISTDITVNTSNQFLATSSLSGIVSIIDISANEIIRVFDVGHSAAVRSLTFSANGKHLLSVSDDGKIIKWDVARNVSKFGEIILNIDGIPVVSFSPRGNQFAASSSGQVQIFDTNSKELVATLEIGKHISCFTFNPDGDYLSLGTSDGSVQIWDIYQNRMVSENTITDGTPISSLGYNPTGKFLAIGSMDSTINVTDPSDWEMIELEESDFLQSSSPVTGLIFESASSLIASYESGVILLWNIETKTSEKLFTSEDQDNFQDIIFSIDYASENKALLFGYGINAGLLSHTGSEIAVDYLNFPKKLSTVYRGGIGIIDAFPIFYAVAVSDDGEYALTPFSTGSNILLWDVTSKTTLAELIGHDGTLYSIDISSDHKSAISGSYFDSGQIIFWDIAIENWVTEACKIVGRNLTEAEWNQYLYWKGPYDPEYKTCPQWPAGE